MKHFIFHLQNQYHGELIRPLRATDTSMERYTFHRAALKACLEKCVVDLKIEPGQYRVKFNKLKIWQGEQ